MKLHFTSKKITDRKSYDAAEAGALNANYTDVEAAMHISNQLGNAGYLYKKDFYFIFCALGTVVLEFYNTECASTATLIFGDAVSGSEEYQEMIDE